MSPKPASPPQGRIEVDKDPTPAEEAREFETSDDRRQEQRNKHELALHDRQLGRIGGYTGSTNPSLNIAAALLAGLLVALLGCLLGAITSGLATIGPYIERLIAAILTVASFIFGVRQGGSGK